MVQRGLNIVLVVVGAMLVLLLAATRADLLAISRRGPKWRRRLIAAGLLVLGLLGAEGCAPPPRVPGAGGQQASPGVPTAAPHAARPLEQTEGWRRLMDTWEQARLIAEGVLGERPVEPNDYPAMATRLAAAERQIDTWTAGGELAGPEVELLKAEFAPLAAAASRLAAPPPPGAGPFDGPWSAAASMDRIRGRVGLLAKLAAQGSLDFGVRDLTLDTLDWDVGFLRSGRGRSLLAAAERPTAEGLCRQAGALAARLRSLAETRNRPRPQPRIVEHPLAGWAAAPGGLFGEPQTADDLTAFVSRLHVARDSAYQFSMDSWADEAWWPSRGPESMWADVEKLLAAKVVTALEGEILRLEIADAAKATGLRPVTDDSTGRPVAQLTWVEQAARSREVLAARLGPLAKLLRVKAFSPDLVRDNLVVVKRAAVRLAGLGGVSALPAGERAEAERLAQRADEVVAGWLKVFQQQHLEPPKWNQQGSGRGVFEASSDDPVSRLWGHVSRRGAMSLPPAATPSTLYEASRSWSPLAAGPTTAPAPPEREDPGLFVVPDSGKPMAQVRDRPADAVKEIDRLVRQGKASAAEAALLRLELRDRMAEAAADPWAQAWPWGADPLMLRREPEALELVARMTARVPLLERLAALDSVHAGVIEQALGTAQADEALLRELIAPARADLCPRLPAVGDGMFVRDRPGWLAFLDPNGPAVPYEEARKAAEKAVAAAELLARDNAKLLARIRQAGPPLRGVELTDTPEWRRLSRTWRQAEEAVYRIVPFNRLGRRNLLHRLRLARADVVALAEAGLLTAPEAELLTDNIANRREFLADFRHDSSGRKTMCYGAGPAEFPLAPLLARLEQRVALVEGLRQAGKLQPAVCAKIISHVAQECWREPGDWQYGDEKTGERDRKRDAALRAGLLRRLERLRADLPAATRQAEARDIWPRALDRLNVLYRACDEGQTVTGHLRAVYLTGELWADMLHLYSLGELTAEQTRLLRQETILLRHQVLAREPTDVRNFRYMGFDVHGWAACGPYWTEGPLHIRERAKLLDGLAKEPTPRRRELALLVAWRLRADAEHWRQWQRAGRAVKRGLMESGEITSWFRDDLSKALAAASAALERAGAP